MKINVNGITLDITCNRVCTAYITDYEGKLVGNMSSVFSVLITEAGKNEGYASDIIYDIRAVETAMETTENINNFEPFIFGFRRYGVDGNSFVKSRIENYAGDMRMETKASILYRSLYYLAAEPETNRVILWKCVL